MNLFHKPLELQPKAHVSTSPDETFHALHDIHARQSWLQSERLWHPGSSMYGRSSETEVGQKRRYQIPNEIHPKTYEETVEEFDPEQLRFASSFERIDDSGTNVQLELQVKPGREAGSVIQMHIEAIGVNGLVGVIARRHRMEREIVSRLKRIDGDVTQNVHVPVEPQIA